MSKILKMSFILALAVGCSPSQNSIDLSTPALQNILSQPFPEYAAKLRIAQQIAASCDRYDFNMDMQVALSAARPDTANVRLIEFRQVRGVELAKDVETRSFQAKHGVVVGVDNLCAAGDREVAEQTGISAFLQAS